MCVAVPHHAELARPSHVAPAAAAQDTDFAAQMDVFAENLNAS